MLCLNLQIHDLNEVGRSLFTLVDWTSGLVDQSGNPVGRFRFYNHLTLASSPTCLNGVRAHELGRTRIHGIRSEYAHDGSAGRLGSLMKAATHRWFRTPAKFGLSVMDRSQVLLMLVRPDVWTLKQTRNQQMGSIPASSFRSPKSVPVGSVGRATLYWHNICRVH